MRALYNDRGLGKKLRSTALIQLFTQCLLVLSTFCWYLDLIPLTKIIELYPRAIY